MLDTDLRKQDLKESFRDQARSILARNAVTDDRAPTVDNLGVFRCFCGEQIIPDKKGRIGKTCSQQCRYKAGAAKGAATRARNKNKE